MNIHDYIVPKIGEDLSTLLAHKNIKINRIVSSDKVEAVEYVQNEDEWLVLLEGEATLMIENKEKVLTEGDMLFIPSKTPHSVLNTQNGTVWLTVHIF